MTVLAVDASRLLLLLFACEARPSAYQYKVVYLVPLGTAHSALQKWILYEVEHFEYASTCAALWRRRRKKRGLWKEETKVTNLE